VSAAGCRLVVVVRNLVVDSVVRNIAIVRRFVHGRLNAMETIVVALVLEEAALGCTPLLLTSIYSCRIA